MKIRRMKSTDIEFAFQCTKAEGWSSETKEVFEGFLGYDPGGCFIAEYEAKRIGLCIATKYHKNGFIGELIITKEMRGRGYGGQLFEHSIQYLCSQGVKNIFLDSVLRAVPLYERVRFRKVCRSLRFVGSIKGKSHPHVRRFCSRDLEIISRIDSDLFSDDRSFFLKRRLVLYPNLCFVIEINGEILGYIMARQGVDVISVGPWAVRGSFEEPNILIERLALEAEGKTLRIGVLESNKKALDTMRAFQSFDEKSPCWRMVLGDFEGLGIHDELFAIGSAAKG